MSHLSVNQFARDSHTVLKGSHYLGTWKELVDLVEQAIAAGDAAPGFRDGVLEVTVPPDDFMSGVAPIDGHQLSATFAPRRAGETPVVAIRARGPKAPARRVRVIIYRADVLGEDRSTDAEWEIVTILAEPTAKIAPMPPITMARNFLDREGGTKGDFSAEQFAEAIEFWSRHAVIDNSASASALEILAELDEADCPIARENAHTGSTCRDIRQPDRWCSVCNVVDLRERFVGGVL